MRLVKVESQTVGWLVLLAIVLIWIHLPRADRAMLRDLLELAATIGCASH